MALRRLSRCDDHRRGAVVDAGGIAGGDGAGIAHDGLELGKTLERSKRTIEDLDLIEINEAFASVVLAWEKELHPDMSRVNVNGGAIAIGHPLGASGARLLVTLAKELRRRGGRYGLATMCIGVGQGLATIVEAV